MNELQRITTEYVDAEDRIRLAGEVGGSADAQVLWLTQRLMQRLLPHLLGWLEQQVSAAPVSADQHQALQGFVQQAAKAELQPQAPVQASERSKQWLVTAVDIASSAQRITLTFKGLEPDAQVRLTLADQPLRQWLAIVHERYRQAGWPLDLWPQWMLGGTLVGTPLAAKLH